MFQQRVCSRNLDKRYASCMNGLNLVNDCPCSTQLAVDSVQHVTHISCPTPTALQTSAIACTVIWVYLAAEILAAVAAGLIAVGYWWVLPMPGAGFRLGLRCASGPGPAQ